MNLPPILAVDFDGCLCTNAWPHIGDPNFKAIYELKKRKARGCKLILWTCRAGEQLDEAVQWSAQWGIHFDAINQNLPEVIELFGGDTRKIYANEYWDDKGVICRA